MDIRIGLSLGGNQVVTARLLERVVEIYSRLSPRTVVCSFCDRRESLARIRILLPSEAKNRFSGGSPNGQMKANQVRAGSQ